MKKIKTTYWAATAILSIMMAFSAFSYLSSEEMVKAFQHLGFPTYFRIELAVAKIIGVILLVVPAINSRLKEWAYAGFVIVLISASIAHIVSDGVPAAIAPFVSLILLITSYITYHRLKIYDKINVAE